MSFFSFLRFVAATLVASGVTGFVHAQHRHAETPSAAAPVAAPATLLATKPLRSIMDGYQRFDADTPLINWRQANVAVKDIGSWQAYARQSAAEIAKEKAAAEMNAPSARGEKK
jgi:hypothetical protein